MKNHDAPAIVMPSEKVPVVRSVDLCVIGGGAVAPLRRTASVDSVLGGGYILRLSFISGLAF